MIRSKKTRRKGAGAGGNAAVLPLVLLAAIALAGPLANAGERAGPSHSFIDEARLGGLAHDLESNKDEDGGDINGEILLHRLGARSADPLDILLTPRPHIGASINTSGDTSVAYAGLTWDFWFTNNLFIEASFGGAVHDGPTDDSSSSFGCTANFREAAAIGLALSDHWRILATVSHMSNAGLCDQNQGLTSAGVQVGYRW